MPPDDHDARAHALSFVALMVLLGTVSTTFASITPMLVTYMGQEWHYSGTQAAWMVTAYTIGNTLGAFAMAGMIRGWRVRTILWMGTLTTLLSNLLIAQSLGLSLALACSVVAGFGSGAISSASAGYLVYGPNPQRNLAALTIAQSVYAALLLQVLMPRLTDSSQASHLFMLMALVMLAVLPALGQFSAKETIPASYHQGPVRPFGVFLILACVFLSFASAGVVWTFVADHGHAAGLSEDTVSDILTASNFLSLLLCLGVKWMVGRRLYPWCVACLLICVISVGALTLEMAPWRFALATCGFVGCWTLGSVLVPTLLPAYDPVGRRAALTPAAFGGGYAAGSLAGGMVGDAYGMGTAFSVAAGLALLSLLLLLALRLLAWHTPSVPKLLRMEQPNPFS